MTMLGSKTYYVYIMCSQRNGTLYIGVTGNLVQRISRHRAALGPGFTRRHRVHRLVFYKTFHHIGDAIRCEKQLKKWKRLWKLCLIEQTNPHWRDLYEDLLG